jgi:hypothetical protein
LEKGERDRERERERERFLTLEISFSFTYLFSGLGPALFNKIPNWAWNSHSPDIWSSYSTVIILTSWWSHPRGHAMLFSQSIIYMLLYR